MKTIAYTALLYGKDYLASAIRSVIDAVDEYHVLYTPIGSHGYRTEIPCPDTREELYEIARQAAGGKFHWHENDTWLYEGQQRDSINQYAPDADVILVVDADEVWSEGLAEIAISAATHRENEGVSRWRVPIIHYWRSMHNAVLRDPAYPERVIVPRGKGIVTTLASFRKDTPDDFDIHNAAQWIDKSKVIHHFGYAQRPEIVEYKQLTHGHRSEWRRDIDWFHDRFMANAQVDCHPVGSAYWNPEPVDPFALGLPEWMRSHPFARKEIVE